MVMDLIAATPVEGGVRASHVLKQYVDESGAFIAAVQTLFQTFAEPERGQPKTELVQVLEGLGGDLMYPRGSTRVLRDFAECLDTIARDYQLRSVSQYVGEAGLDDEIPLKRLLMARLVAKDFPEEIKFITHFLEVAERHLEGDAPKLAVIAAAKQQVEAVMHCWERFPDSEYIKLLSSYTHAPGRFIGMEADWEEALLTGLRNVETQISSLHGKLENAGEALALALIGDKDFFLETLAGARRAVQGVLESIPATSVERANDGNDDLPRTSVRYYEERGERHGRAQIVAWWHDEVEACIGMLQDFAQEFYQAAHRYAEDPQVKATYQQLSEQISALEGLLAVNGPLYEFIQTAGVVERY